MRRPPNLAKVPLAKLTAELERRAKLADGPRLAQRRLQLGLSRAELARKLGYTAQLVWAAERGLRPAAAARLAAEVEQLQAKSL